MKNTLLSIIFVVMGVNFGFAQSEPSDLSKKPIFILKLSNGIEKVTRDPVLLSKQAKDFKSMQKDSFLKKYKDIQGSSVFVFELEPNVTALLSIEDIFDKYKIPEKYKNLPIVITGHKEVIDKKTICATENSIESVFVDIEKKIILIKTYPDKGTLK